MVDGRVKGKKMLPKFFTSYKSWGSFNQIQECRNCTPPFLLIHIFLVFLFFNSYTIHTRPSFVTRAFSLRVLPPMIVGETQPNPTSIILNLNFYFDFFNLIFRTFSFLSPSNGMFHASFLFSFFFTLKVIRTFSTSISLECLSFLILYKTDRTVLAAFLNN